MAYGFVLTWSVYFSASCEDAFVQGSTSNGVKVIKTNNTTFKVFCIFNEDQTGWVYVSTEAIKSKFDVSKQNFHRDQVKVRIFFNDGTQKDSKLQQITAYSNRSVFSKLH